MKDYKASLRDVQRVMVDLRLGKVKVTEEEAAVSQNVMCSVDLE